AVTLRKLSERVRGFGAKWALEVGENDDGDRRALGAAAGRASGLHLLDLVFLRVVATRAAGVVLTRAVSLPCRGDCRAGKQDDEGEASCGRKYPFHGYLLVSALDCARNTRKCSELPAGYSARSEVLVGVAIKHA